MALQFEPKRVDAMSAAKELIDSGQLERRLGDLVALRTESQNPAQAAVLDQYLRQMIRPLLINMGFEVDLHQNPIVGAPPLLLANRLENPDLPTILIYGHGDVTHGQDDAWDAGLSPFATVTRDGLLFGRGTADNKGQHLINLMALKTLIDLRGSLGFNAKVLIEMGEEIGSPGLDAFCAAQRLALAADVLIASDGPRLMAEIPTLFMGSRGAVNFDLDVRLRNRAHHSGNWGGLLADPATILIQALASLTDARGQIMLSEWRPSSLTPDIRAALARLPDETGDTEAIDPNWGEEGLTPNERVFGWNSFAVLAMKSGVPEAPVNAISGHARATCQLRFVVGTDADDIVPALRRHLDRTGFEMVDIIADDKIAFQATRVAPDNPWVNFVATSLKSSTQNAPHILPNLAGSLPNHCFSDILGLPTIWIPHSYRGCAQHAPNEHVPIALLHQALSVMVGLYWDLGQRKTPERAAAIKGAPA